MRTAVQAVWFFAAACVVMLALKALDLPVRDYRGVAPGISYQGR